LAESRGSKLCWKLELALEMEQNSSSGQAEINITMKFQLSRVPGCVTFLLVLLVPATLMAFILRNPAWLIGVATHSV